MNEDRLKLLKFILQIVVSIATALITALSTTACVRHMATNDFSMCNEQASVLERPAYCCARSPYF